VKNIALLLIFVFTCSVFSVAQDSAIIYKTGMLSKGKVTFYGNKYEGSIIEFDAPAKVVEEAIKEMMSKRGYKPTEKKDFLIYKNVLLRNTEIKDAVDVYASVEAKSRSEKNKTLVSIIITQPGAIPENKMEKTDAAAVATMGISGVGVSLLSDMEEDVSIAAHNNEVALQQALIVKTERDLNYLVKDSIDFQQRLENLKLDIEKNGKAQTAAKQKLLEANNRLDMLKARKLEKKN
jgi:hypothetical protein